MKKFRNILNKHKFFLIWFFLVFLALIIWTQPTIKQQGTTKIWDRNNILLYETSGNIGKKIPVSFEQLPENLINATIVSEDNTFWTNPGVDFKAIFRSLYLNVRNQKITSGASTITQQLARSAVIPPQQAISRSLLRKFREILIAFRLNATYPKKQILTMYLNQMYYGNLSFGIQAASQTYFNKDVSQLSLAESAFLTGLLSSPDKRNPFTNIEEARKQQFNVLDLMVKQNSITYEQASQAKQEPLSLNSKGFEIKSPHFVQYVMALMEEMEIKTSQGINIYTTLDFPTYLLSQEIAGSIVNKLSVQHDLSNAALVLIKNDTGEILDMLGGVNYFDASHFGQVNMTTALRQPGSALKPVTYATGFMQGLTPATLIYDVQKVYQTKKGEGFTPHNYDGHYHGLVLAREALASSLNLPAVEILNQVGIPNFLKSAKNLGITTFNQEERYDLAITLGGGEVKLLDLTNVYASFGRGGKFLKPFAIKKITTDDQRILFEHKIEKFSEVLGKNSEQIAFLISNILSDPKARIPGFGEKNPLVLSHQAAVKTGTTTDWHDNWTVGFTPSYTVGVWVGNDDNHPMREITGVVGAAPIWNQFFEEFLKGKPKEVFVRPSNIKEVEICALSGKLPDNLCPEKTTELFIEGTEPKEKSSIYKKIKIDTRNGFRAGDDCPREFVQEKIMVDYPPQVFSWALGNNKEVIPQRYSSLCNLGQINKTSSFLEITNPKDQAVFEYAPLLLKDQAIVFEASVSSDIATVQWFLDNVQLKQISIFPFSISWIPKVGKHVIKAVGISMTGEEISSKEAAFSVVEFKGNY